MDLGSVRLARQLAKVLAQSSARVMAGSVAAGIWP